MVRLVDIAMSVYGKPFQTAVTLASLFENCGKLIDKVYLQEEFNQPHGSCISQVIDSFPDQRFIHYIPKCFLGWHSHNLVNLRDMNYRQSIRYQFAWENTDKKYLFISHNDCLYHSDIIGNMLDKVEGTYYSGIGLIGQCWNCPASIANVCNRENYLAYNPTFDEVRVLIATHTSARTRIDMIDPAHPVPLPECRLNEFACLINLEACRSEVMPIGAVVPFAFVNLDVGTEWFRQLSVRGHRFLNWSGGFKHGPFSPKNNGHAADFDVVEYNQSEKEARQYLVEHYPEVFQRLMSFTRSDDASAGLPDMV